MKQLRPQSTQRWTSATTLGNDTRQRELAELLAQRAKNTRDDRLASGTACGLVRAARLATLSIVAQLTLRYVVIAINSIGRHEYKQLLRQHQTHDLIDKTAIVAFIRDAAHKAVACLFSIHLVRRKTSPGPSKWKSPSAGKANAYSSWVTFTVGTPTIRARVLGGRWPNTSSTTPTESSKPCR